MEFDNDTKTITAGSSTDPLRVGGTAGLVVPIGTTAQRPTGENGILRYNTDNSSFEVSIDASTWAPVTDSSSASINGSWKFDTLTTNSDPGSKKFKLNNATLASVTAIYISETTNTGVDAATAFSFLSTGDKIYIQQKSDSTKSAIFSVSGAITDNGTWVTIPVTVSKYTALYGNNQDCGVVILYGGSAGGSGTVTSVSVTTSNGVSGTVANATTTPAITLTLGDITPTTVKIGNVGTETSGISVGGTVYNPILTVSDIGNTTGVTTVLHKHSTTLGPLIAGVRSNSDTSSHTAVTNGMPLFTLYAAGTAVNGSSDYKVFGNFNIGVDDAGTISATSAPGKFELNLCPDGSTTTNQAFKVNGAGNATILNTLTVGANPLNLTGFLGQFTGNANSYVQVNAQNRSAGTIASSDIVLTTNTGSDTTEYIDLGINCSGWTGSSYGAAKDGYLYVEGGTSGVGNLVIGTSQANTKVKFSVGAAGANGSLGILELTNTNATTTGNMVASKGIARAITSTATAAGTTTLTVSSTYHQIFTGTSTQTVVLPDATTLVQGQAYQIQNNSTGIVTVNKNGGTLQFVISAGMSVILICSDTTTAAGVWDNHMIGTPATQNFITATGYTINNSAYTVINAAVRITPDAAGTYFAICTCNVQTANQQSNAYIGLHSGTSGSTTLITGAESYAQTQRNPVDLHIPITVCGITTVTAGQIIEPKAKNSNGSVTVNSTTITIMRIG